MVRLKATVLNDTGLHARPAALFTKFCSSFDNEITMFHGNVQINPKSIIQVLGASLAKGSELEIVVEGDDAESVASKIVDYIHQIKE
jgi:phosphocarrier protein